MRCPLCGGSERAHIVFVDPATGKTHTGSQCPKCGITGVRPPVAEVRKVGMGARNWVTLGAVLVVGLMIADRLING